MFENHMYCVAKCRTVILNWWCFCPHRGHLYTCGDISVYYNWRGYATGIYWAETRDVVKHPIMHKTAHHKQSSGPKHTQMPLPPWKPCSHRFQLELTFFCFTFYFTSLILIRIPQDSNCLLTSLHPQQSTHKYCLVPHWIFSDQVKTGCKVGAYVCG